MRRSRWLIAIALGLTLLLAIAPQGIASDSPRLSSLESELLNQRQRLDRLESQLGTSRPAVTPSVPGRPSISNRDPMFDRLATLSVELKEDIRDLQADVKDLRQRLTRIEQQTR